MSKDNKDLKIAKTVKISCDDENCPSQVRLDSFLIEHISDYSRTYFQKLVKQGLITVNGSVVNKSFLVKSGDSIDISFPEPPTFDVEPAEVKFDILAKYDDFLIINKPAGLTVHHSKEQVIEPTLVHGLLYKFKEFCEFDNSERPGIVHRLDKQTSGLLVVARNQKALIHLSKLFKDRQVEKQYLAVVKGHPDPSGTIDLPIGRHPVERNKMSHVSYVGKRAVTHYKVEQYYDECALVSVRIETGRTHQIRVHFAANGHRLLGDSMYGIKSKLISRQALHSWKLGFSYEGEKFSFTCPVPEDFRKLLFSLKEFRVDPIS